MMGFDRRAARYVWTAAMVVAALYLLYEIRRALFIFILALLFAYLLSPLVNLLDRFLPGQRTRTPALALAYAIFVAIVVIAVSQIGSRMAEQARDMVKEFPDKIAAWQKPDSELPPSVDHARLEMLGKLREEVSTHAGEMITSLPAAGLKFLTVASGLIYVVIIPILAFFFLKDGAVMRDHLLDLLEAGPGRALLEDVLADVHLLLAHYMRALVLLSCATFVSYIIAFTIIGVPYGILLAALAGLLEFIPMVGPLSAGVFSVLVALTGGAPALTTLIFLLAYRIFQDYILSPHLMGVGVELHPLLALFGVFAGAEVAGIPGTLLSIPVLAVMRIIYLRIRKARVGARLTPDAVVR